MANSVLNAYQWLDAQLKSFVRSYTEIQARCGACTVYLAALKVQTHNSDFPDLYVHRPPAFRLMCGLLNAVRAEKRRDAGAAALFVSGSLFRSQGVKSVSLRRPALEKGCCNTAAITAGDHFRSALGCCQATGEEAGG